MSKFLLRLSFIFENMIIIFLQLQKLYKTILYLILRNNC